jgi:hypothetical protein
LPALCWAITGTGLSARPLRAGAAAAGSYFPAPFMRVSSSTERTRRCSVVMGASFSPTMVAGWRGEGKAAARGHLDEIACSLKKE